MRQSNIYAVWMDGAGEFGWIANGWIRLRKGNNDWQQRQQWCMQWYGLLCGEQNVAGSFNYCFDFLSFFQGDHTLSKKNVWKPRHSRAGCITEPYNASRQPVLQFWPNWVKVVTFLCAWAENIANAWLPIQTYGKTSKGRSFNSKVWIKVTLGQISSFNPFCVPM